MLLRVTKMASVWYVSTILTVTLSASRNRYYCFIVTFISIGSFSLCRKNPLLLIYHRTAMCQRNPSQFVNSVLFAGPDNEPEEESDPIARGLKRQSLTYM